MSVTKQILIVENNQTLRELLEFLLSREGYQVKTVSDGDYAQKELRENPSYHLIILDLLLPIITGRQLLRWIRRTTQINHIPILVLTDLQDEDDIASALDEGANDYVIKPFQPKELQARIRKLLQIKRSSQE
ncbi:response regulator transcription factor [Pseudidiomarina andamanensis]|uniref:DNA-binding response regulator n=1 Tax=Pseudidiomarina andamanensis TaxID=1940690 RepID=A0AA92ET47_9GAMM|nr:response regulator transcription factor [Pseudidiomarina andamanensis]MDS0218840.1 response regulator transcription factor [Pseudidiomarina andamanensis]QGT96207.1 DNA-binding response regulator [Pseudidiomarina andamanensis]